MNSRLDIYLVPSSGNTMGVFSVSTYKGLIREKFDKIDSYYKNMSDSEMFDPKGDGTPQYNKETAGKSITPVTIK